MGCGASTQVKAVSFDEIGLFGAGTANSDDFMRYEQLLRDDKVTWLDLSCFNARASELEQQVSYTQEIGHTKVRLNFTILAQVLPNAQRLTQLFLNQNRISGASSEGFGLLTALRRTRLHELHIARNPLRDEGLRILFDQDEGFFAQLRVLDLSSTDITDEALDILVTAASSSRSDPSPGVPQLSRLSLAGNLGLTARSLGKLEALITACPNLEWISFASCANINTQAASPDAGGLSPERLEESIARLEAALSTHSKLQSLVLFGTSLGRDIQARLMRAIAGNPSSVAAREAAEAEAAAMAASAQAQEWTPTDDESEVED